MASYKEIRDMIKLCKIKPFLLHCVSIYPCPKKKANLNRFWIKKQFKSLSIGYSDHTTGVDVSIYYNYIGCKYN